MARIENWLPQAVLESVEYRQACTHRSAGSPHNERLEFLGDALLGQIVSELLYRRFPNLPEGDLTRLRAHLVCRTMLGKLAMVAELDTVLAVDERQGLQARARRTLAGNALEAVIAAVRLVSGHAAARTFVEQMYGDVLRDLPAPESLRNPKAMLQEILQAQGRPRPCYTLLRESPGQSPRFAVQCAVPDPAVETRGHGERVREAEKDAAMAAIAEVLRLEPTWTP